MNNPTAPSKDITIYGLKKLVNALENPQKAAQEGAPGIMTVSPSSVDLDRGSDGIMPARSRVQFKFWMDIVKEEQFELSMEMMLLKSRRKFTTTIRDAMRLILDLRAGHIDILLELFPWVKDAIAQEIMR